MHLLSGCKAQSSPWWLIEHIWWMSQWPFDQLVGQLAWIDTTVAIWPIESAINKRCAHQSSDGLAKRGDLFKNNLLMIACLSFPEQYNNNNLRYCFCWHFSWSEKPNDLSHLLCSHKIIGELAEYSICFLKKNIKVWSWHLTREDFNFRLMKLSGTAWWRPLSS